MASTVRERIAMSCGLRLGLLAGALGGCATTGNLQLVQDHLDVPSRVLILQSPMAVEPDRLQSVLAPDVHRALSIAEEPISQGIERAQAHALSAMESALAKQGGIVVVSANKDDQVIRAIQGRAFGVSLSQSEADRLRATTGADALLRFSITDYGLTPKSWRSGYIAFEIVTTAALAGVIAYSKIPAAKAAAGAYLAQEAVEETAEAYAGFWALDVVSRPVKIAAELIRLNSVAVIWQTSDTGLSDVKLSRLTRKVGTAERDGQLDQSSERAVNKVVAELSEAWRGRR